VGTRILLWQFHGHSDTSNFAVTASMCKCMTLMGGGRTAGFSSWKSWYTVDLFELPCGRVLLDQHLMSILMMSHTVPKYSKKLTLQDPATKRILKFWLSIHWIFSFTSFLIHF
jgi:hypothetical protein